jgi:hypothetical protein
VQDVPTLASRFQRKPSRVEPHPVCGTVAVIVIAHDVDVSGAKHQLGVPSSVRVYPKVKHVAKPDNGVAVSPIVFGYLQYPQVCCRKADMGV